MPIWVSTLKFPINVGTLIIVGMGIFRKINNRRHLNKRSHRTFFSIILVDTEYPKVLLTSMIEITSRFAIILVKYSTFNKRRHPNKSIGMGKFFKINKRRAYVYSELKSTLTTC